VANWCAMNLSRARIQSIGTATPPDRYTQQDILDRFRVANPMVQSLFQASHIESRYLFLPKADAEGVPNESQEALLRKHRKGAMHLGREAIERCLEHQALEPHDIDYLCCISSTGLMLPGLTAMFIKHLGFRTDCHRTDIVGMGCNAGLNGLNPVVAWCNSHPQSKALMVCCEVNSALYVYDDSIGTGVVNSLFGDGCAAALVCADGATDKGPAVLGFQSHLIPEAWGAMRYDWSTEHGKFSFHLARDVPYVLGLNTEIPVDALLGRFNLKRRDIAHWIIHSGGKKVIDAIKYNIGITAHDVRHTTDVLREYGNLGSGSFLFSFDRLQQEGNVRPKDYGVMMTMGPGSTIETALIQW
jgi:polyketide synthase Type III